MVKIAKIPTFVVGDDPEGDEFVVHLYHPIFVARIAETNDAGEAVHPDEDADTLHGLVFAGEGFCLCQVVAMEPEGEDLSSLSGRLREAAKFVTALRDQE